MQVLNNLTVIGTSHIAKQSVKEIKEYIKKEKPNLVAVELDRKRLSALMSNQKRRTSISSILRVGVKGYLFGVIGAWISKKLGKVVGIIPGADMKTAIREAKKINSKVALIDQDIELTLRRFSSEFSWKEKLNILIDLFKGLVLRKNELKELGIDQFDLTKVPDNKIISKLIKSMKKRYPNIYKVLIEERNHIMANRLSNIMSQEPESKILAVVGAGHEEEIIKIISKLKTDQQDITYTVSIG